MNLPEPESLRLELQEALTTYRHHTSLVIQAFGFIVAADSALLAYVFTQRVGAIFLIASLMPIVMLITVIEIMPRAVVAGYAAIRFERKLLLNEESFSQLYFQFVPKSLYSGLANVESSKMHRYMVMAIIKSLHAAILYCVFILQLGLLIISLTVYHYRFM